VKVKCRNESDVSNSRDNWTHLKIIIKYLSNLPGKREIKELQKTSILDAAHVLREVTGESIGRISWEIKFRVPYTVTTDELQRYTPFTNGFCYIIVNSFYISGKE